MELPISIKTNWDVDLHVHNKWSLDIPNGPKAEEYLSIAEENQIHIGFLDHYEIFYEKEYPCPFPDKKWVPVWPFKGKNWERYLEEMDELRINYSFVSTGLEIDYYPDLEDELRNFIDDYGNEFDLLVGSLHELEHFRPVTLPSDLRALIKKHGSFEDVIGIYYNLLENMIKSKIFNAIAHIDTIYRYVGSSFIPMEDEYKNSEYKGYTRQIIDLCIEEGVWIEFNLSGYRYPIGRPFPPRQMIEEFGKKGAKIFIGSDSHKIETFQHFIPKIKETNKLIRSLQN
ncbi:MAG: histidinol-phosphatase HisJ family protein [Promethearchaeota archaeon]